MLVRILLFFVLRSASDPCATFADLPEPTCTSYQRQTVCVAEANGVAARAWWETGRENVVQLDVRRSNGWEPARSGAVALAGGFESRLVALATTAAVVQSYNPSCSALQPLDFSGFYGIY